jgi:DNA-directed RNA polymerase specialized sigma24 family protein
MIESDVITTRLSLSELEARCRSETRRYRREKQSDPRFCLEIFQRALRHIDAVAETREVRYQDDAARELLVQLYSDYVKAQINRAALRTTALEDMVQQAWIRFWSAANNGLAFDTLEAALAYLRRATVSTLIEQQRSEAQRRSREESLQLMIERGEPGPSDSNGDPFDAHRRRRFRERCREILGDTIELRVLWMRYSFGLAPNEIAQVLHREQLQIGGRTATARLVSDLLGKIFARLALDGEIRDLLRAD